MVLNFWPFNRKKSAKEIRQFDVKIAVATCILDDGKSIRVTRKGQLIDLYYEWYATGDYYLRRDMNDPWIRADDGIKYNRNCIRSYTYTVNSYIVDENMWRSDQG